LKYVLSLATAMIFLGSMAPADGVSEFSDPAVIMAELQKLANRCSGMSDGQVDPEIFGLSVERLEGGVCVLGEGEIDDHVRKFLEEMNLDWAGLESDSSIWVKATE
jgi:hypothetical protein